MKLGFLIILLFGLALNASTQSGHVDRTKVYQSRLNIGEPVSQFENKFRVGIFSSFDKDIPLKPRMTVQSELQYSMFGSVVSYNAQQVRHKTTYLMLPVLVKYNLDNGLSLVGGAQAGRLMSANSLMGGRKYDFRRALRNTDWFLVLGADYHVRGGISVGVRYQRGLLEIGSREISMKNRGFSLDISYELGDGVRELLKSFF